MPNESKRQLRDTHGTSPRPGTTAFLAQVLALWFGVFTILNVMASWRSGNPDLGLWWVDLRFLPRLVGRSLFEAAGLILVSQILRPPQSGRWRHGTLVALAFLGLAALSNTVAFYRAWGAGSMTPKVPIPMSLLLAALLVWMGWVLRRPPVRISRRGRGVIAAITTGGFLVFLPLLQILCFGTTDYRRGADAIVVLGAKVDPGGIPSRSLTERMQTAVALYRQGLAPRLIVSGGIEPTGYDETAVMRDWAIAHGVPPAAIQTDPDGVNTEATARNTTAMFAAQGLDRVLVVSHFYHLPRIKLAYQSAGHDVLTVPSESSLFPLLPFIVAREVPAFWVYFLRTAIG